MNTSSPTQVRETYREAIQRMAAAMAMGHSAEVYGDLEAGSQPEMLKLFVDGNLDKRFDKLDKQLEFVKEAFGEQFEELSVAFIRSLPLGAYDSGQYDGDKFLAWIEGNVELTPEQRDYVACQRARHNVENIARTSRKAHIRFQELRSLAEELSQELDTNPSLRIHLNPIRVWARFETGALTGEEEATEPTDVLFFPVGKDTSSAALEEHGRLLIEELSQYEPCSLATWAIVTDHADDRDELIELCRDLAAMGLVAFS